MWTRKYITGNTHRNIWAKIGVQTVLGSRTLLAENGPKYHVKSGLEKHLIQAHGMKISTIIKIEDVFVSILVRIRVRVGF